MSNKTSDNNVANIEIIKNFIFELKSFGLNKDTLEVANELENLLSDYTRQKQINEEHKKQNAELMKAINTLEKEKGEWIKAYQEEKDSQFDLLKRIQELEEKVNNSISIQNVIEAINVHQDYLLNQATTSNPTLDANFRDRERYAIQVLQELLEGEKNNENIKS